MPYYLFINILMSMKNSLKLFDCVIIHGRKMKIPINGSNPKTNSQLVARKKSIEVGVRETKGRLGKLKTCNGNPFTKIMNFSIKSPNPIPRNQPTKKVCFLLVKSK